MARRTYRRDARGRFASGGGGSVRKRYHAAQARRLGRKVRGRRASEAQYVRDTGDRGTAREQAKVRRKIANLTVRRDRHRRKAGEQLPTITPAAADRAWAQRLADGERVATRIQRRADRAEDMIQTSRARSARQAQRGAAQRARIERVAKKVRGR